MKNGSILILGARSEIGRQIAHQFASNGWHVLLAARSADSLLSDKLDLDIRYKIDVTLHEFNVLDVFTHYDFVNSLPILPDVAVCCVGMLGNQELGEKSSIASIEVLRTNFEGPANILAILANKFEERGSGTLVGISSVAGERGRASNYIYGSAKSGLTAFLSGLRNRLAHKGVNVLTVLPGFVETRMTEHIKLIKFLTTQPNVVAKDVYNAVLMEKDTIYCLGVWRLIMLIINFIPERFFKKMRL